MRWVMCAILSVLVVTFGFSPLAWGGGIPAKTLKELKAASVYIKVQYDFLGKTVPATGSGFVVHVEGDSAFIATNHHVVNALSGEIRKGNPKVVFHSGTPDETTFEAQVMASDPIRDLAVLKVKGVKPPPKAIRLDADIEVIETMPVYAFGFPFGEGLALGKNNPAITITRGTVSSIRTGGRGQVKLVQIDAEINPGNSGGPVVDDKGNLVGVAVSKILKARTVGFAVPVEALGDIMRGKVARVAFDTLKVDQGKAEVQVEASLLDPMAKLKDVTVLYRRSADAKDLPRPDKEGKVERLKDAATAALKVENGKALGKFSLAGEGKEKMTIAYQTTYVTAAGKTVIMPASLATVDFTQLVRADTLTRDDPIDMERKQPHKLFPHKMQAGKHYIIEMRGDPKVIDPWLVIRDSTGKTLAEDDDSGGLLNSLIVFSPPAADEYQIVATVLRGAGPFTLRIREDTGRALGPRGLDTSGTLADTDPPDPLMQSPAQTFNFIFKKGKTYAIDVKSKDFDPYLRLENMAGVNLKNEDVGGNGHSTLILTPFQDGIYRLIATTFDYKVGEFTLQVRETAGPKIYDIGPGGLKLAGVLNINDPILVRDGKATKARHKVYPMKMKAGQKYQIDMVSNQFDTYLRIEDAKGKGLAEDDDSGGDLNSRLIFTPPADGVYRIIATHFDNRLGQFDLTVRLSP